MLGRLTNFYDKFMRTAVLLTPLVLLIIRLGFGWDLFESGRAHLENYDAMVKRFTGWHIPYPQANVYISAYTEMIGGALWMAGLGTRLISVPLFFNFCVAYLTASRDEVVHFFQQNPTNFIEDAAFPFLVTSILLMAFGAGAISIDRLICAAMGRKPQDSKSAG